MLNITIKSGTNAIHGDVWEYFRNTNLDAEVWNSNPLQPVPPFHLNQFGATLGFPISKDKLFYFGDIQNSRYSFSYTHHDQRAHPAGAPGKFHRAVESHSDRQCVPDIYSMQPNSNTGTYPSSTCKTVPAYGDAAAVWQLSDWNRCQVRTSSIRHTRPGCAEYSQPLSIAQRSRMEFQQ